MKFDPFPQTSLQASKKPIKETQTPSTSNPEFNHPTQTMHENTSSHPDYPQTQPPTSKKIKTQIIGSVIYQDHLLHPILQSATAIVAHIIIVTIDLRV